MDGIEAAPPLENARNLRIGGDLIAWFGHGLSLWTILTIVKVYWRESQADEAFGPSLIFCVKTLNTLAIVLLLTCAAASAGPVAEPGEPPPALKGTLFSGETFDLALMRGKVVLVNFYSSYCSFCAYEIGNLEAFYEKHRDEGFAVIVVGIDSLEDRHRVERMLGIYGLPGLMADNLEQTGFERRYPTPTAFVVDRSGILRSQTRGAKQPYYYAEKVLPLLQEKWLRP